MPAPQPRYGPRRGKTHLANPPQSRWTSRRKALAALPTPGPPTPTYDLVVTGTITPDATGGYNQNGTYGGQPAYERSDGAYWITTGAFGFWYIGVTQGGGGSSGYWFNTTGKLGTYTAQPTFAGTPTVAPG